MTPSPAASLLVAALVVLRQPCARNKATARLLLERAAEYDSLSPAEREACRDLADDLDIERAEPAPLHAPINTTRRMHAAPNPERRTTQRSRRFLAHGLEGGPA
ncbi:MAG: hypothetical protein K0M39_01310 [Rhizobium sp.]|jgi:hypothetical protein|uniref:hypothetical protein n=1 Tax=Thiobacillus sp. TaxID=924 RepID=UPI0025E0C5F9|nr:hypothetical protein [Thiobacillus sp.]MBW8363181.1 hypothetical protein [Rhizobium sp.]